MSFLKPVSSQGIIQLLSGYKNLDCHLYKVVFSGVTQFWSPLMSLLDATMTPILNRDGINENRNDRKRSSDKGE